jgi:hypothetical protein
MVSDSIGRSTSKAALHAIHPGLNLVKSSQVPPSIPTPAPSPSPSPCLRPSPRPPPPLCSPPKPPQSKQTNAKVEVEEGDGDEEDVVVEEEEQEEQEEKVQNNTQDPNPNPRVVNITGTMMECKEEQQIKQKRRLPGKERALLTGLGSSNQADSLLAPGPTPAPAFDTAQPPPAPPPPSSPSSASTTSNTSSCASHRAGSGSNRHHQHHHHHQRYGIAGSDGWTQFVIDPEETCDNAGRIQHEAITTAQVGQGGGVLS